MRGLIWPAFRRYKAIEFYHHLMEMQFPDEYDRSNPIIDNNNLAWASNKWYGAADVIRDCLTGKKSNYEISKYAFDHIEIDEFFCYAQRYFEVYGGLAFYSEDKVDYSKEYTLKDLIDIYLDLCDYYTDVENYNSVLDEYYSDKTNWRDIFKDMSYNEIYITIEETGNRDEIHEVLTKLSILSAASHAVSSIGSLLMMLEPEYRTAEIKEAQNKADIFNKTYL